MPTTLAERVAELERQVATLKQAVTVNTNTRAAQPDAPSREWQSTVGAFKDDAFYDDVVRHGRAYRRRRA
jgi:hypothetical protein